MSEEPEGKPIDAEVFDVLKHDIKNQLSNIQLAIEGLKFEVEDQSSDLALYMDSIARSAKKIDQLLNGIR